MPSKTFKYTTYAISIIEKLVGSKFSVSGLENIPKNQPILFVANHFTRFETFLVPYLIYKNTSKQTRSLADSSLYHGFLGRFLRNTGTVSTKDEKRDKIILKDLMQNNYSWLIYPEGSMIKNKKIDKKEIYSSNTPYGKSAIRTGSAVLALKSQLYRQELIDAWQKKDQAVLDSFKKEYNIEYDEKLKNLRTFVVPLTISYYPIRPGENKLEIFAKKRISQISDRLVEELQIEGNLLQTAQINLHFGEAINLATYIRKARGMIYQIPIIQKETKSNFVIRYFKYRLTTDFMKEVYSNLSVNLDHIFSAVIRHINEHEILILDLKRVIYFSALMIAKTKKYILNASVSEENLCKIFIDEPHHDFDDVFNLAKKLGEIVQIDDKTIRINKKALFADYDFHKVRLESTLQVIYNEFYLLENAINIVKRICKVPKSELKSKVLNEILQNDIRNYEADYEKYFDPLLSKSKDVGRPYFLRPKRYKNKVGVLLCHGYGSSPKEVFALAQFLLNSGYFVYAVRMKGHGTSPINIKDVTWLDWYDSLNRGYAYLRNCCDEIVAIGFSTGGLLTILASTRKSYKFKALISINAALKLEDLRVKFVPAINFWNELLYKVHFEKAAFEYVENNPENPEFNYTKNYLKGVEELSDLMQKCEKNYRRIEDPTLIIQASDDPVVTPESGKIIYKNIASKLKKLYEPKFTNHGIINGNGKEIVFAAIKDFLIKL